MNTPTTSEPEKPAPIRSTDGLGGVIARIQNYLGNGGLFNPEAMEHEKVRDLIMDCRDMLDSRRNSGRSDVALRIYTRCPACHNDTLIINAGRLLCTWHVCPDPTLIDRMGET